MSTNRQARRRRPLPPVQPRYTARASRGRQSLERLSAAPLLFLRQMPGWILPVALVVVVFVGLSVRGPLGALALCVAAGFLGWLAVLSWPRLSARGRLGRIMIIGLVLAVAVIQALR